MTYPLFVVGDSERVMYPFNKKKSGERVKSEAEDKFFCSSISRMMNHKNKGGRV